MILYCLGRAGSLWTPNSRFYDSYKFFLSARDSQWFDYINTQKILKLIFFIQPSEKYKITLKTL